MPVYRYRARTRDGQLIKGRIAAPTPERAADLIEARDAAPVAITTDTDPVGALAGLFTRIPVDDLLMVTFQLGTLVRAGIPLLRGLQVLAQQIDNRALRRVLLRASRDIESGATLSEALARHPRIFSPLYTSMIHAGEESGRLEQMLARLESIIEHESRTREQVRSALRYPAIVLTTLAVAFVIIMWFVVPQLVKVFNQFNLDLPLPTRIMIGLNNLFQTWGPALALVALAGGVGLAVLVHLPAGRMVWHRLKLRLPIFGPYLVKVYLSRFSQLVGTLNASGLPIIETLRITAPAIGNDAIAGAVDRLRQAVAQGHGLAESLGREPFFTPLVVEMIALGEESGQLDETLATVTRYYDREIEHTSSRLGTYIEPLLTLCLTLMVLGFALAVFLPLWDMTKIAGR